MSMDQDGTEAAISTKAYTDGLVDKLAQKLLMYMIPKLAESNPTRHYREPSTEAERTLQLLWATTLSISPGTISASDSSLKLEGDSISAMQLVSLAGGQGKLCFILADVFRHSRLEELTQVICSIHEKNEVIMPFSLPREGKGEIWELAAKRCGVISE
ncbi:hypothetical protein PMG11_05013 [Penicillium brasilianum]|uniref:Carrier domain-containing protein n=1 Tax=Penicillium brasilianum TaxID=104259 RepID=A0A0F7VEK4_PENBI|nr:hypothetical protein PMG11_05013 [Penicillium brasilianum]